MTPRHRLPGFLVHLGLFLLFSVALTLMQPGFAQALVQDPRVQTGTLPNGVRYAVMANQQPAGRASLRLLVNAGSLDEKEEQRGLAHFLEHMAFNGSQHYAPGSLVEFFQRMGMSFGGDTNASTGPDRTQYLLELADSSQNTLREGLQVLSDYAGGLLLPSGEIDKERGIIASEKLSRDSVQMRTSQAAMRFLYAGTLMPERWPIGLDEVIKSAPRERFVDFYNAWYRPDNIAVILVGDFEPQVAEALVKEVFGPMKARAPAVPRQDRGHLDLSPGLKIGVHRDTEATSVSISLYSLSEIQKTPDSVEKRLRDIPAEIAVRILARRVARLSQRTNAPILGGGARLGENFDLIRETFVQASCRPENWKPALQAIEQELRRALIYGFQEEEVREVVANFKNNLSQSVARSSTRRSPDLANGLLGAIKSGSVFTTPETNLELIGPFLDELDAEQCREALRLEWARENRRLFVSGNFPLPETEAISAITEAFNASSKVPVQAPKKKQSQTWDYTDFGKPGTVVERREVEDLGLTLVTFVNGVRLNIKKTAFEAGRIQLLARVGEGTKTMPASLRGIHLVASGVVDSGGLARFGGEQLQTMFAGKNVGWRFTSTSSAFQFSGSTTPADMLLEFQFLAAKLSAPGFRASSLRQSRKGIDQVFKRFKHSPEGPMAMEIANLLASGDPRFGMPEEAKLMAIGTEEVKSWILPQLSGGGLELAVVGDVDVEACIKAASETIGALPERQKLPVPPEMLKVSFPQTPFSKEIHFDSELSKSLVAIFWPSTDGMDARVSRRMNLLSAILSDRLRVKIREEMGGTYSPKAQNIASDTYPGYGYLETRIEVAPEMAEKVAAAVIAQADDLAKHGVTADELERARKPMLTNVRESMRNNAYWLSSVVSRAQSQPVTLDWARTRESDIASITKEQLDELAAKYLGADRVSKALILSTQKASN